jgi:outer membrane receptor protein involved in Fe transport
MQMRRYTLLVVTLLLPAAILLAAGGKIRGKVTDRESGEALIGATVQVVGTSYGATTDINGVFTILNLNPDTYTLKSSYIGYQTITLSNVRVNADLTTESNFALPAEGVSVQTVEIIAQRPLIEKSATNETRIIDADVLSAIPIRSVTQAAAMQPGVVLIGNAIYVRGSRADETGYVLDGVNITDVLNGGRGVTISQDAVEQIQVRTGGYPAEYGGANGGIISTNLRSGGEKMHFSLRAETDNYTKQGTKSLGGYSYGYSDYVASLSGPVISNKIRFFGTAENEFYRDPAVRFWNGLTFSGLSPEPQYTVKSPTKLDTIALDLNYPAGNRIGGQQNTQSYTATLSFDLGNIKLRTAGAYSDRFSQNTASVNNFLDADRLPINNTVNGFGNVKLTQFFTPKMYYELNVNYYRNFFQTGLDPQYKTNWIAYGDTSVGASNPSLNGGQTNLRNSPYYIFGPGSGGGYTLYQPGTILATGPSMTSESSLGGRLDFSSESDNNALKFGGEYTYYTIRRFAGAGTGTYQTMSDPTKTLDEKEAILRGSGYNNYGYNVQGNPIDNNVVGADGKTIVDFGPPHPVNAGVYIQDAIQLSDINLNIGVRYDYISPDSWSFADPQDIKFDETLSVFDPSSLVKTPATQQLSPRIGASFPVTDRTVFHAQYGKFVQQSQLIDSYGGMGLMYNLVHGGNYYQTPVGFGLKPERTTHYELGFSQQLGDNASFDITTFYKDIRDLVQFRLITPKPGASSRTYYSLVNGDFATSKGVEFKFTLRRTNRIQAQVNYTYGSSEGTGSSSNSAAGGATDQHGYTAKIPFPTSFSQENTGSINIDYHFAKNDGGTLLERSGLNLLMRFGSGYPFTLETISQNNIGDSRFQVPLEPIGYSSTPWTFQVDVRIDKIVSIASLETMFYIYVQNVLNARNANSVFVRTGDPANDGWLGTSQGQSYAASQSDPAQYQSLYNSAYLGDNANNYLTPRQIRFGVKIDY